MSKYPHQIVPVAVILVLVVVAFVVARQLLVPETFGDYGHYRGASEEENRNREFVYAGSEACADCHDEIYETKTESHHKGVACEVCHGPGIAHIDSPEEITPQAPRGRGYCPLCHGYNPSRPSGFPQIIPDRHNPGKPCMECHEPHNPLLPHTPEECSACHRDVANVKNVSHHVSLPCTQCHKVPDKHKSQPRQVRAEKPKDRSTCAVCHSEGASASKSIPRVDFDSHGERYECWDCHYPHFPEAHDVDR